MQSPGHQPIRFEPLEARRLRSADAPAPEDGNDYHLLLNDDDTVVRNAAPEANPRTPLSHFTWYDGSHDAALAPMSDGAMETAETQEWYCWPADGDPSLTRNSEPDEANVRTLTRRVVAKGVKLIVIDNETWRFDVRYASTDEINHTIERMTKIFNWIHDEAPDMKVGLYGYMSQSDDTNSVKWSEAAVQVRQGQSWYQANLPDYASSFAGWQATSEYLRPLSQAVDYLFPALYTGTTSPDSWANAARITLEDTRRYGKPVIPFLMPYYHPGVGPQLAMTELPTSFWERELDTVEQYADGALIWTPENLVSSEAWVAPTLAYAQATMPGARPASASPAALDADSAAAPSTATAPVEPARRSRFSELVIGDSTTL